MSKKHLPRLFAQTLNEKRVELFDQFIHPEYDNHNPQVQPGQSGVKAFFRHYLDAFPDTKVVMEDVIEEGDRISARFTYKGTSQIHLWAIGRIVQRCSCGASTSVDSFNGCRPIRRRARAVGIQTKIRNHTFRAIGITGYLKNGGKLEIAQHIAAHESSRTTGLYDRQ